MTRLQEFLDYDDDAETFWERVATHLDTGKLRLIFVADIIPYELKRIIEFLNEQMNPAQVLGVEIKQYVGQEGLTSLVPRVIGQTTVAQQRKSSSTKKPSLTEAMFFDTIPSEMKEPAYRILDWAKQRMTRIDWGSSSFTPILTHKGLEYRIVSLYTSGSLEIKFEHLLNKPPFDDPQTRRQVFAAINNIVSLKHDDIDARPSFQYAELQGDNIDRFISILDEFVALVRMEN
jgi:hypothetical protein